LQVAARPSAVFDLFYYPVAVLVRVHRRSSRRWSSKLYPWSRCLSPLTRM
jgi:hypothetical protein